MFSSLFNNNKREISNEEMSNEEKEDNKEINDCNKADIDNAMISNIINNNMTDKLSFLEGTIYDCATGLHFEWVEGYKIVDKNMCGMNNYQYKLNKEYTIDTIPVLADHGFHFSLSITDCINNKGLFNGNRIFKVKGFVLMDDYRKPYDITRLSYFGNCLSNYKFAIISGENILVASKIILYEEVFINNISDIVKEIYPFVNSFEFDEMTTYKNLIQNEIIKIYDNKDLIYLFNCAYKPANTASAKTDFYKIKIHTTVDDDNGKRFMNEFLTSCMREVRCY